MLRISIIGLEVIGEAENGKEAIEKVESLSPDILILDINMPFYDGLEVSKIVKEKHPGIEIVIISGYSDFKYAQEGIKLGVFEYVLKPIDEDKFEALMVRIRDKILNSTEHESYVKTLEKKIETVGEVQRDVFLSELIHKAHSQQTIVQKFAEYKMKIPENDMVSGVIELDGLRNINHEDEIWLFVVNNIAREVFEKFGYSIVFSSEDFKVNFILENSHGYGNFIREVENYCDRIRTTIDSYYDFSVTIGIGKVVMNIDSICQSYCSATSAMMNRFYLGINRVISSSGNEKNIHEVYPIYIKDKAYFIHCIRSNDKSALNEYLEQLFMHAREEKAAPKYMRVAFRELVAVIASDLLRMNIEKEKVSDLLREDNDWIEYSDTFKQLNKNLLLLLCYANMKHYNNDRNINKEFLVDEAVKYIYENYANAGLTLDDVASSILRNPNYLAKIFKQAKAISVIKFLNDVRLIKAAELIKASPGMQMSYITEQVGYTDPFYFTRFFKKKYGVPPSKYMISK